MTERERIEEFLKRAEAMTPEEIIRDPFMQERVKASLKFARPMHKKHLRKMRVI